MKKKFISHKLSLFVTLVLFTFASLQCSQKKESNDLQGALITAFTGSVQITRDGKIRTLSPASLYTKDGTLLSGDQLKTEKNSTVDLEFVGGIQVRIGPLTKIKLDRAAILTGENYTDILFSLEKGKLFTRTLKLSSESNVSVATPTSIASVRGTEFLTVEENNKNQTLVNEGAVSVQDESGKQSADVEAGNKAEVDQNGTVDVKPLTDADKNELASFGSDIQRITESGREQMQQIMQTFEENKQRIQQAYDEQKEKNEALIRDQKEKNKQLMDEQKDKNKQLIDEQKEKNEAVRNEIDSRTRDEVNKASESGRTNIQKVKEQAPSAAQDEAKSQLEKLKQGPK